MTPTQVDPADLGTTRPRPDSTLSRSLFTVNAVVAWFGIVLQFGLTASGIYSYPQTDPGAFGDNAPGAAGALGRILDYFSYFTILSNIVVAVVMTMLAIRPLRDGRWFRALRLDSVLMILVTGVVYAILLAPVSNPQGWDILANAVEHQITPVLTVLVWLICGPRDWFHWRVLPRALVIPLIWLVYTFVRGAVIHAYPYPFIDVVTLGYGTAIANAIGILVAAIVVVGILIGIDVLLTRATSRPAATDQPAT